LPIHFAGCRYILLVADTFCWLPIHFIYLTEARNTEDIKTIWSNSSLNSNACYSCNWNVIRVLSGSFLTQRTANWRHHTAFDQLMLASVCSNSWSPSVT
jgi:hypothetical protein